MMTAKYVYTDAPQYISGLAFDYIETYSFQRGEKYEEKEALLKKEYEQLKAKKDSGLQLTAEEQTRYSLTDRLTNYTQSLLNDAGQLHFSAQKTHTFGRDDPAVLRLMAILQMEVKQIIRSMCAPFYRDAVIFYDPTGQIVSVLNICLSCGHMETKPFHFIDADIRAFDQLKRFFIDLGHDVEEPDSFLPESMIKKIEELPPGRYVN